MSIDPVAIIERAHHAGSRLPAGGAPRWLESVAELVLPALSPTWIGGLALLAEPPPPEPMVIPVTRPGSPLDRGTLETALRAAITSASKSHRAAASAALRRPGVTSLVEAGGSLPPWLCQASPLPIADVLVVSVPSHGGRLAAFAIAVPEPVRLDVITKRLWRRIAVHLGCALGRLGATEDALEPAGEPEAKRMLADEARDQLRRVVRDMDRRRPAPAAPDEALELWGGLLSGRWSLVDHFDDEGRRYVLARQNADHDRATRLSRRQRQVAFHAALGCSNKEIGFALGLAENTVSAHLTRAMTKMGIRSRTELVRLSTQVTVAAEPRVA